MRSIAPSDKYPITYPKLCSRKLDGIRCCMHNGKAVTKSGKPIPNHHIREWLEANVPDGVDGELISGRPDVETCYGTTFTAVMTQAGTPEFSFHVFDLSNEPYLVSQYRKARLNDMFGSSTGRIFVVEQTVVYNESEMQNEYNKYISEGYEGAILVDPHSLYLFGRSSPKAQQQMKLKPEDDFEARILGVYEGQTNNNEAYTNDVGETQRSTHAENKVGNSMVGGYNVEDVLTGVRFNVGPGKMTHSERIAEWQATLLNPQHRIGDYLKYRSMSYGSMTNGAARHGRWIGWRDKTDMNPEDLTRKDSL